MKGTEHPVLEAISKAIQAEVEGHHFYLMAAASTPDALGQEVFKQLAQDEQDHAAFLRSQHKALSETGKVDASATLGQVRDWAHSPIFSDALRQRVATAHFEMTALSVGIQLEADAQRFYRAQAEAAEDAEVRAFFLQLAEWEAGHYHALLQQQEALKEDYWSANQFAPF